MNALHADSHWKQDEKTAQLAHDLQELLVERGKSTHHAGKHAVLWVHGGQACMLYHRYFIVFVPCCFCCCILFSMMICNGLYIDKQQRTSGRNGKLTGGRGFVQTSGTTGTARNIGQFFARFQSLCIYKLATRKGRFFDSIILHIVF